MVDGYWTRNPGLLVYATELNGETQFAVETSSIAPPLIIDDPRLLWAISALPASFSRQQATALWLTDHRVSNVAAELWDFCCAEKLIIELSPENNMSIVQAEWDFYHVATRSYPFLNMSKSGAFGEDNALMRSFLQFENYPNVYLELPAIERIELEQCDAVMARIGEETLTIYENLSIIFNGTFGKRRYQAPDDNDRYVQLELIFKSIPSGGSRHPTECLAYLKTEGIREGLYHYNVAANALDLVASNPSRQQIVSAVPALADSFTKSPNFCIGIMLLSIVERAAWRYRESRSFRAILVDAGHAEYQLAQICALCGYSYAAFEDYDNEAISSFATLNAGDCPVLTAGVMLL
jgi:SagB-type dehydrogenase family enzyme